MISIGGRVVCLERSGRLVVAHFRESRAEYGGFFSVEEEGSNFGFGGGRHDVAENLGNIQDWTIGCWVGVAGEVAEKMM
jgi:hypothetical protein